MSFQDRALALHANGYTVVPIRPGEKRPGEDGWVHSRPTEKQIKKWALGAYKNGNVGINTHNCPAVDIDVYDEAFALSFADYVIDRFGATCVRVGRAPKRLIMFRTDEPFRKLQATYTDGKTTHKIEILGAGQQFVAYGVHPETKKDYEWVDLEEPRFVEIDSLPLLTLEDAESLVEEFCARADKVGWTRVGRSAGGLASETGDGLETFKPILQVTEDTITETLDLIPNNDDYDQWLRVGCALHHQFEGKNTGLRLWHEWGQKSDKYEAGTTNFKYKSFGHGPGTATFASLIYDANKIKEKAATEAFDKALNQINSCNDKKKLTEDILGKLAEAATNDLQADEAIKRVQLRLGEITDVRPRLEVVRKMFNQLRPKQEINKAIPKWCEGWVYIEKTNMFYSYINGKLMNKQAFDMAHGRHILAPDAKAKGESFGGLASNVALNVHEIPTVYDSVYLPGNDRFLRIEGREVVNVYDYNTVPPMREPENEDDIAAVQRVIRHFEILFPDERERRLLIDWMAYNVQFPGEKITWAPLIQGVDGGGKTWLRQLLRECVGKPNIRSISAERLKDTFTGWAQGRKIVVFEEIRLHGQNRFEILDKMKPYISNEEADVRNMQREAYEIINVTNYLMFTNFFDALPINQNDRRYFIIRTAFQTESHIVQFEAQHPGYFTELFGVLEYNAPAIHHWLAHWELSDEFKPKAKAPKTAARTLMISTSDASDEMDALERIIHDSENPLISNELLSSAALRESDIGGLASRTLGAMLAKAGFAVVTKCRLNGRDDDNVTYYTRRSELFNVPDPITVIRHLAARSMDGLD